MRNMFWLGLLGTVFIGLGYACGKILRRRAQDFAHEDSIPLTPERLYMFHYDEDRR